MNDEPISLDDVIERLNEMHSEAKETGTLLPPQDAFNTLDRLINARLVVPEGRSMGLDGLPEVDYSVDNPGLLLLSRLSAILVGGLGGPVAP